MISAGWFSQGSLCSRRRRLLFSGAVAIGFSELSAAIADAKRCSERPGVAASGWPRLRCSAGCYPQSFSDEQATRAHASGGGYSISSRRVCLRGAVGRIRVLKAARALCERRGKGDEQLGAQLVVFGTEGLGGVIWVGSGQLSFLFYRGCGRGYSRGGSSDGCYPQPASEEAAERVRPRRASGRFAGKRLFVRVT